MPVKEDLSSLDVPSGNGENHRKTKKGVREEEKHDGVWDERKGYPLFFLCVFLLLAFPFLCLPYKYSRSLFETTLSPGSFFRPTSKAREKRPGDEVVFEIAMLYSKILDGVGSFERLRKVDFTTIRKIC